MATLNLINKMVGKLKEDHKVKMSVECSRPGRGDYVFAVVIHKYHRTFTVVGTDPMVAFIQGLRVGIALNGDKQ